MATNVVMPKMGESITEGTILRWLKKVGDAVAKDEPILEISTDKVDTEVPSPVAGTLLQQVAQEKETVSVGGLIAVIGDAGEKAEKAPAAEKAPESAPTAAPAAKPEVKETAAAAEAPAKPAQEVAAATPVKAQAATPSAESDARSQGAKPAPPSTGNDQAVVMPKMGESITEGTVLRWLKKEGDTVAKDEPILEISTDKVDTEIPAPFAGTLTKIVAKEKETVSVGAVVAYIGTGEAAPAEKASSEQAPATVTASAPKAEQAKPEAPAKEESGPIARSSKGKFYSPLVRAIAQKEGISQAALDALKGTGLEERVTKGDVLEYLETRKASEPAVGAQAMTPAATDTATAPTAQPAAPQPAQPVQKPAVQEVKYALPAEGTYSVIPMDNIRQKIAEHMVRSKHTSAHVTSLTEVDVTNIVNFRIKWKEEFKKRYGVGLTYTPIFIEAMVKGLREYPFINASIDGTNVILKNDINFGVAVSLPPQTNSPLPPALIVPVIKHADRLNLVGLSQAVADLAARARSKKLTPDDISGGTFTLTNPGMYGNLIGTPIINQPQLAIMTTGAVVKRVVVRTDEQGNDYMAIRSMMFLGMSYDHRLVDGAYAVQFTDRVRQILEGFNMESI